MSNLAAPEAAGLLLSVMGDTWHSLNSPLCASVVPPAESLGPDERTLSRKGLYKKLLSTTEQTWAVYRHLREDQEEAEKTGLLFTGAWLGNEMAWWGGVFNVFQASPTPATSGAVCTGNPFIYSRDKNGNVTQWRMKDMVIETAQEVEVLTAKSDVLSSIPGIHIVEWENQFQQINVLWPLTYTDTQAYKRVKIYKAKKAWEIIEDSPLRAWLREG